MASLKMTRKLSDPQTPHARIGRAAGRGAFLIVLLGQLACSPAANSPAASTPAAAVPPAQAQTKELTLYHGLGFVCAVSSDQSALWCWASEAAALANGDAGRVGLTSTVPTIVATNAPGVIASAFLNDSEIQYETTGGSVVFVSGDSTSTANVYTETISCDVTGPASYDCPGEAVPDITISWNAQSPHAHSDARPGDRLWFQPDLQLRHYPHSPTWLDVRCAS